MFADTTSAAIECAGVGYKFVASLKTLSSLPSVNSEAFVYIYMNVKQDGVDLIGFNDVSELEAFKLLIAVSNVGPKVALAILSSFSVNDLYLLVASEDAKGLSKAPGVGLKTAQRIVLELKDKIGSGLSSTDNDIAAAVAADKGGSASKDAVAALVQFGYSQSEASLAVGKCDLSKSTEEIIKQALKLLSTII